MPGINVIAAPGHTPGHMALTVNSRDEELLILSDSMLHPIHIEQPEWYAIFDFDPQQSISSRRHLLNKAVVDNDLVLAFHFTYPGLGYVIQKGEGWQWLPIDAKN
jgi:glyoxylase-like metal-dependent hydrolase (beta-lactamase superfamily II)